MLRPYSMYPSPKLFIKEYSSALWNLHYERIEPGRSTIVKCGKFRARTSALKMSTENALPPTPSPIATNALAIAFERSSTQRKSRQNPCNVSRSAEGRLLLGGIATRTLFLSR